MRYFMTFLPAALLGLLPLLPLAATAQTTGGPIYNRTVFADADVTRVTAVTEVFGNHQSLTTAIIEFSAPLTTAAGRVDNFSVEGRTILSAKVTTAADPAGMEMAGSYVILTLDPDEQSGITFGKGIDTNAEIAVSVVKPLERVDGTMMPPTETAILNTAVHNQIVDDFTHHVFSDPVTGLKLHYNLYVPQNGWARPQPLVLFMHDAGITGSNTERNLQQGLGAVSFASPADQSRHPAIILAPQFPAPLANDAGQTSVYVDMIPRLITALTHLFTIDEDRITATGQSGGCMASIALNLAYPDLFAGTLCVAGQWDASLTAPLAQQNFWAIVS